MEILKMDILKNYNQANFTTKLKILNEVIQIREQEIEKITDIRKKQAYSVLTAKYKNYYNNLKEHKTIEEMISRKKIEIEKIKREMKELTEIEKNLNFLQIILRATVKWLYFCQPLVNHFVNHLNL